MIVKYYFPAKYNKIINFFFKFVLKIESFKFFYCVKKYTFSDKSQSNIFGHARITFKSSPDS